MAVRQRVPSTSKKAAHARTFAGSKRRESSELKQQQRAQIVRARKDFFTFASLVLMDEKTGAHVKMATIHRFMCAEVVRNRYNIFLAAPEIGKTQLITVAYAVWRLGRDPRTTIAIICAVKEKAQDILSSIKKIIDENPACKRIFPSLRQGKTWTTTKIRVAGAGNRITPSVGTFGVGNKAIMGSRLDVVLLDDYDNAETTATKIRRDNQFRYVARQVINRLMAGGEIHLLSNAWHVDDVASRLSELKVFKEWIIPLTVTPKVKQQWASFPIPVGHSIWTARWPAARIRERRAGTPMEDEWRRCYYCEPLMDGRSFFKEIHFQWAREMGEGMCMPTDLLELLAESGLEGDALRREHSYYLGNGVAPEGWEPEFRIVTGVDIAAGVHADLSGIVTLLEYLKTGHIRILYAEEGDWHISEMWDKVIDLHTAFGGHVVVETQGIQVTTLDLLVEKSADMPIFAFPTRLNDKTDGFRSIAGDFAADKMVIPSHGGVALTQGLEDLVAGLRSMNPREHVRDIAMAMLFAAGALRAFRLNQFRWDKKGRITVGFDPDPAEDEAEEAVDLPN